MRLLATVRADGSRELGETVLKERGSLGEGVVMISRTVDAGPYPEHPAAPERGTLRDRGGGRHPHLPIRRPRPGP